MPKFKAEKLVLPYKIADGKNFHLKDIDPADTNGLDPDFKDDAAQLLQQGINRLTDLQERLYAQDRWAVLLIFQAMDAAGKDSTIKHVMSGVNPQGVQVYSFKTPSTEELDHDFLWRTMRCLPERGRIGIFNRSYYEETLVVRVHPELLERQRLPPALVTKKIWDQRYKDIRALERYLARNGMIILKFFLHVSKQEQKRRFLERIDDPAKQWKFSAADVHEREHWQEYMAAYQDMIQHTSSAHAPWYVVPADHKWFTRLVVGAAIIDVLERLELRFPKLNGMQREELAKARQLLLDEPGK